MRGTKPARNRRGSSLTEAGPPAPVPLAGGRIPSTDALWPDAASRAADEGRWKADDEDDARAEEFARWSR